MEGKYVKTEPKGDVPPKWVSFLQEILDMGPIFHENTLTIMGLHWCVFDTNFRKMPIFGKIALYWIFIFCMRLELPATHPGQSK